MDQRKIYHLVLTADNVQLLVGLIEGRLEAEPLVAVVASLRVGGVQLGHKVVRLGLPFSDNLVKVLAPMNEMLTFMQFGTP